MFAAEPNSPAVHPRRLTRFLSRAALLAMICATLPIVVAPPAHAVATVTETNYLTMADGTQLKYTLVRPATGGPFGTLFEYSGYDPGSNPDSSYISRYVASGKFAYIGVNLRGTGCSEGTFDFF